jgi:hypothetical protein
MPRKFTNWREFEKRRTTGSGTTVVDKEVILLPTFDTFIYNDPAGFPGVDRWNSIPNSVPSSVDPLTALQIPVGLINPWNDANEQPTGGIPAILVAPRTPTRAVLSYDLSGISAGVNIVSATLNLTVANSSNWDDPNAGTGAGAGTA